MRVTPKKGSIEDVSHRAYGCLAQSILVFVLAANLLAFAFSAKYRAMIPLGKFVLYTALWTALTVGFWWMKRKLNGSRKPSRKRRPQPPSGKIRS